MKGLQIIADFHNCTCDAALLREVVRLEFACLGACQHAGLTVVTHAFHQFGDSEHPGGATGAVVLAESHLAVHSWPELRAVTLDIYVCNVNQDNGERAKALYDTLHMTFQPCQVQMQMLERGNLSYPLNTASYN